MLTFGQGHQPIIEWAKGLCKLGTQGKEPDQHKAQKLFAWCFLFDPESKIEKVPCILQSDPTLLHFSAKLPTSLLCLVYLSPFGLQSLCQNDDDVQWDRLFGKKKKKTK